MTEAYHRPFGPHDRTGPVTYAARTRLCQALPNAMIREGMRTYYKGGWYEDVETGLPKVEDGFVSAPDGPGLGLRLQPEFLTGSDVTIEVTSNPAYRDISRRRAWHALNTPHEVTQILLSI